MKLKLLLLLVPLLGIWTGCSDDEPEIQTSTRTVLVYMMANNSLEKFTDDNIDAMIEGASYGRLNNGNLLIYYAGSGTDDHSLYTIADNQTQLVKQYDEQDPTDPAVMQQVIADVVSQYPAESYGLILWSHGTGWLPSDFNSMLRAFGQDGNRWMEIDELCLLHGKCGMYV